MTVFLSYVLSFTLALVYGPYLFIAAHLLKHKKKTHRWPIRFTCFLLDRQNVALWSQLLFRLAIATACAVRSLGPRPDVLREHHHPDARVCLSS